ncbi:hypothetical protein U1Q18_020839 [Sarracenia purpurea var. burkii]
MEEETHDDDSSVLGLRGAFNATSVFRILHNARYLFPIFKVCREFRLFGLLVSILRFTTYNPLYSVPLPANSIKYHFGKLQLNCDLHLLPLGSLYLQQSRSSIEDDKGKGLEMGTTDTEVEEYSKNAYDELVNGGVKKNARTGLERMLEEHEKITVQLEEQSKDLKQREKELEEQMARYEKDSRQLYSKNKMLQREKEELQRILIEQQKKLDANQSSKFHVDRLGVAHQVMGHLGDEGDVGLKNMMDAFIQQLEEKEQNLEDLERLNQTLIVKERKSNDEIQEARKELISGFMDSKTYIGVKRMGEVDINPFLTVAKRKYEGENVEEKALELCSLWEDRIRDPNWYPFKLIPVESCHKTFTEFWKANWV